MKLKTKDLIGAALDWAVAAAFNKQTGEDLVIKVWRSEATTPARVEREDELGSHSYHRFSPSTGPQGDSIIDVESISTIRCDDEYGKDAQGYCNNVRIPVWAATTGHHSVGEIHGPQGDNWGTAYSIDVGNFYYGPTRRIAAMRCYVTGILGIEIDLPETLE